MALTELPVKNPIIIFFKVVIYTLLFQFLLGFSLVIGFLIEDRLDLLINGDFNVMMMPDHRVMAWSGLTLLLLVLPVSGLLGRLALRSRPRDFYFLDSGIENLFFGALGGIVLAGSVVGFLLILGHATLIAGPMRLMPQEICASLLTYALLMLFVGYYEELVCRGIMTCEWSHCGKSWIVGITFSGFLFGLLHIFNVDGTLSERFRIVVSGILFSWLLAAIMLRYKSLKAAIGVHAGWNYSLGCLTGCLVSGQRLNLTLFQTEVTGPDWVTGGDFGLETSLVVNGLLVILIWFFWRQIDFSELKRWKCCNKIDAES